jgi:hypothetical protein
MKTYIKRALRTFLQTAIGYITVAVASVDFAETSALKATLTGIAVSAIAAGIAAVMNYKEG